MDEVSLWQRELTEAEALELFNSGAPGDLTAHSAYDDLEAWWRMGEGSADATMTNMVAGDIVEDSPFVQAGGGSDMTARALEDDEAAADLAGDASVTPDASLIHGAEATASGAAAIDANAIVRPYITPLQIPEVTVVAEERLIGYQPGRETPPQRDRLRVAILNPGEATEQNRSAPRVRTTIRKDTGVSSVGGDDES